MKMQTGNARRQAVGWGGGGGVRKVFSEETEHCLAITMLWVSGTTDK